MNYIDDFETKTFFNSKKLSAAVVSASVFWLKRKIHQSLKLIAPKEEETP